MNWQTIHGVCPSKANCYKIGVIAGHGTLLKTAAVKAYENAFFLQVGEYRNLGIAGFFELHIRVFYPSNRSDLDNSLKVILDCLQYTKTIKNDNKCVRIVADKFVDKNDPRIEFKIETV